MRVFPQVADCSLQLCFDQTIMLRCLHAANFSERSVGGAHGEACFQSEDHLSCRSDGGVRRVVFRVRRVRFVLAAAADRAGHAGGSAHVRARDGRGVAVHGQLPKHHQQFVQRRLRVQGPALLGGGQERRPAVLGGQRLPHPVHELRPAQRAGHSRRVRDEGSRGVQRRSFGDRVLRRGPVRRRGQVPLSASARSGRQLPRMPRRAGRRARHHRPREGRLDARVGRRGNQHRDPPRSAAGGHARQRHPRHGVLPVDHRVHRLGHLGGDHCVRAAAVGRHARGVRRAETGTLGRGRQPALRREGSEEPHRRLQRHGGRAAGHVRASGIAGAGAYGGPARGERPAGTPARQAGAA